MITLVVFVVRVIVTIDVILLLSLSTCVHVHFRRGQYVYDTARFQHRVLAFEMTDHHPPRLELMAPFCREVRFSLFRFSSLLYEQRNTEGTGKSCR